MQTVIYDGTFDGFLSAVFDVYYYKWNDVTICKEEHFNGNVFQKIHQADTDQKHSNRVWQGLQKKLSIDAAQQFYKTFLSELPGIENVLLQYAQYLFSTGAAIETDFSHPAVLMVHQTAKKVHREKHRMEAFVRFQQTADKLYYAIVEPDYNVLPLITKHFKDRYADQRWMIWDSRRRYGIYYDLEKVSTVQISFDIVTNSGKDISNVYDEKEVLYQQLWQQYFKSVNIPARKNTKLHIQHMPARYWKYLPEKRTG
jgi:probable DNA metabolism protein